MQQHISCVLRKTSIKMSSLQACLFFRVLLLQNFKLRIFERADEPHFSANQSPK